MQVAKCQCRSHSLPISFIYMEKDHPQKKRLLCDSCVYSLSKQQRMNAITTYAFENIKKDIQKEMESLPSNNQIKPLQDNLKAQQISRNFEVSQIKPEKKVQVKQYQRVQQKQSNFSFNYERNYEQQSYRCRECNRQMEKSGGTCGKCHI